MRDLGVLCVCELHMHYRLAIEIIVRLFITMVNCAITSKLVKRRQFSQLMRSDTSMSRDFPETDDVDNLALGFMNVSRLVG